MTVQHLGRYAMTPASGEAGSAVRVRPVAEHRTDLKDGMQRCDTCGRMVCRGLGAWWDTWDPETIAWWTEVFSA